MPVVAQRMSSWGAIVLVVMTPLLMLVLMAMPMDHNTSRCPFMPGETSLCPMSVLDHLSTWVQKFSTTVVEFLTFAITVFAFLLWPIIPKPERPPGYRRRSYPAPPFLQELFSSGILNSKAYQGLFRARYTPKQILWTQQ